MAREDTWFEDTFYDYLEKEDIDKCATEMDMDYEFENAFELLNPTSGHYRNYYDDDDDYY